MLRNSSEIWIFKIDLYSPLRFVLIIMTIIQEVAKGQLSFMYIAIFCDQSPKKFPTIFQIIVLQVPEQTSRQQSKIHLIYNLVHQG